MEIKLSTYFYLFYCVANASCYVNLIVNKDEKYDGLEANLQLKFSTTDIDGRKVEKILNNINSLHFYKNASEEDIISIKYFPDLKNINLFECYLQTIPEFVEVPNLSSINLGKNNLKSIRNTSFRNVHVSTLKLDFNKIDVIERSSFGRELEALSLTCNNLHTVLKEWFVNPASLRILSLIGNKIVHLPKESFEEFYNMEILDMSGNQMTTIGDNAFGSTRKMHMLTLTFNNLTKFSSKYFTLKGSRNLSLELSYNKMNYLPPDFYELKFDNINLIGNPWSCPCWDEIREKIGHKKLMYKDQGVDVTCIKPLAYSNICIHYDEPELHATFVDLTGQGLHHSLVCTGYMKLLTDN